MAGPMMSPTRPYAALPVMGSSGSTSPIESKRSPLLPQRQGFSSRRRPQRRLKNSKTFLLDRERIARKFAFETPHSSPPTASVTPNTTPRMNTMRSLLPRQSTMH